MRGKTARKIRKEVYGQMSLKNPRRYRRLASGQIVLAAADPRAAYQMEKKDRGDARN